MSLESLSRLSDLSGFAPRTIKLRIERLSPIREGKATLYETRDALPLMYEVDRGEKQFNLEQERARLSHHQANREQLKEGVERGELIPAPEVIELGAALIGAARAKILAIPSKLRGRFPSLPHDAIDALEQMQRDALTELGTDGLHGDLRARLDRPQ
jgi:phage terminase Nu1 subunit (DNA packaging protein)